MHWILITGWVLSCWPAEADLAAAIERHSHAPKWSRAHLSQVLAKSILSEARRHRIDPIGLAAVGKVESDFRTRPIGPGYTVRGKKIYERGVYQIAPKSAGAVAAWRFLKRCLRSRRDPRCPGLALWRSKDGWRHFSAADLRDPRIGTWVAAFEVRLHLESCRRKHPGGHPNWRVNVLSKRLGISRREGAQLHRWSHYNVGPQRPRITYTRHLAAAYARIKKRACRGRYH